jgi:tRNA pseudouridine38-40 synthase
VRTIESIRVERAGEVVTIAVVGHGFLRHMVRIIVGSLVDVGLGRQPPDWVLEVLNGRDRTLAGRTAPAKGLVLAKVELGSGPHPRSPRNC